MRSRNSRTNRPTNAVRLARSVAWMTMRAAGKSVITASICMKRCGASGWSAGDGRRASSRAIAYGRSSSRAARDGSCAPAKRSRARVEKPRKTNIRIAAMSTCTTSGRASRAAYSRVLLLNARISSGTRGNSLRSSAPKPRCQSGARSRTKRLVPSATVAACSCSSASSTAALRSTRRSLTASTRACQARRRATASSRAWTELSTRRATTSPAAAVSGRPRVSDQTRRACASSSRTSATRFASAASSSFQPRSGAAAPSSSRRTSSMAASEAFCAIAAVARSSSASRSGPSAAIPASICWRAACAAASGRAASSRPRSASARSGTSSGRIHPTAALSPVGGSDWA